MPTRECLETLKRAEEQMREAEEAHRGFIENPSRDFSDAGREQNRRLLEHVRQSIFLNTGQLLRRLGDLKLQTETPPNHQKA